MNQNEKIIFIIGEILFDVFEERMELGGAPFNFAFHLKKMGFPVRFISKVGADELGGRIIDFIKKHGFNAEDIQVDPHRPTGTVRVSMSGNDHAFEIVKNVAWDRLEFNRQVIAVLKQHPSLIYFGSLIQRT